IDALEKIGGGARFRVAVFELNANNHGMRRAFANALAIQAIERDGRIAIVTSANALQPDGQNDNGWNQGLLFLDPSKVWLQPPGYVTQMLSRNYLPQVVRCKVTGTKGKLDGTAKRSEDGSTLQLQDVHGDHSPITPTIRREGFSAAGPTARVTELSGHLDAVNTADRPRAIVPKQSDWKHGLKKGRTQRTFPPHSFTIIRWENRP